MDRSLWLVGPIGCSWYLHVEDFPTEDEGCNCIGLQKALAWDCAIVSSLLGKDFDCTLIGNHLGSSTDARAFRSVMEERGVRLQELGNPERDAFDVVIISKGSSTRTWISNIAPSSYTSLMEAFRLLESRNGRPDIIYFDHWQNESPDEELCKLIRNAQASMVFCNVGDCHNFDLLGPLCEQLPSPLLLQVSYKHAVPAGKGTPPLAKIGLRPEQTLLATYGHLGALICTVEGSEWVKAESVFGVSTVGAGAYLSAGVLKQLAVERSYDSLNVVNCIRAALVDVQSTIRTTQFTQHLI